MRVLLLQKEMTMLPPIVFVATCIGSTTVVLISYRVVY
jgi:hypothetical protein